MKKVQIIILVVLVALLSSCSNDDKTVTLGLLRVPNDAMLAKQLGLFEEKFNELGYEVEYVNFDSGVEANKALVSGDIDFATMGNINGIVALGNELDVELVWFHETLGSVEALVARDGSDITEVSDLVGKTIATPFASTAHYVLLNVLKEEGIEVTDVTLLDMTTAEIYAAWQRGDIDASYTWQPTLGKLLETGTELVNSEDMIAKGYMTANIELVNKTFASENEEVVAAYIECMQEAYEYFEADRNVAIEKLALELELDVSDVTLQVSGSIWTSLEDMQDDTYIDNYVNTMFEQADFLLDQGFISRDITLEEMTAFITNEYALEVK